MYSVLQHLALTNNYWISHSTEYKKQSLSQVKISHGTIKAFKAILNSELLCSSLIWGNANKKTEGHLKNFLSVSSSFSSFFFFLIFIRDNLVAVILLEDDQYSFIGEGFTNQNQNKRRKTEQRNWEFWTSECVHFLGIIVKRKIKWQNLCFCQVQDMLTQNMAPWHIE